mmetsp:Transcript_77435/g.185603  ORF Transcript_77435/g.185603 Transcript_77435/m.185603 type:complete len:289 (-) Transcript_77435:1269-2135(-)
MGHELPLRGGLFRKLHFLVLSFPSISANCHPGWKCIHVGVVQLKCKLSRQLFTEGIILFRLQCGVVWNQLDVGPSVAPHQNAVCTASAHSHCAITAAHHLRRSAIVRAMEGLAQLLIARRKTELQNCSIHASHQQCRGAEVHLQAGDEVVRTRLQKTFHRVRGVGLHHEANMSRRGVDSDCAARESHHRLIPGDGANRRGSALHGVRAQLHGPEACGLSWNGQLSRLIAFGWRSDRPHACHICRLAAHRQELRRHVQIFRLLLLVEANVFHQANVLHEPQHSDFWLPQ